MICGIKCKVAEEKNILITAEGLLMPVAGSGRMYKWWHKDYRVEQIWDLLKKQAINRALVL